MVDAASAKVKSQCIEFDKLSTVANPKHGLCWLEEVNFLLSSYAKTFKSMLYSFSSIYFGFFPSFSIDFINLLSSSL